MKNLIVSVSLTTLLLALTFGITTTVPKTEAASSVWATPQPVFCLIVPSSCTESHQPWVAGVDSNPDLAVSGIRVGVRFSISNTGVIQADNELGSGIMIFGANLDSSPSADLAGIDYAYYGMVNVGNGGSVSFASSGWITCEWRECPYPYVQSNLSSCTTVSGSQYGSNGWKTCHDTYHWQLFVERWLCSDCTVNDQYIIEMSWVSESYLRWRYYKNNALWHEYSYTPRSDWIVGRYFKTGQGDLPCTDCHWWHFQFGVTSPYNIGTCCWTVYMEDPSYLEYRGTNWRLISNVKGRNGWITTYGTFYDNKFIIGGKGYNGMEVTGSSTGCSTKATFAYTGTTVGNDRALVKDLWGPIASSCVDNAQFISQSPPPSTMCTGQTASVSVTMKNTGTTTWSSTGPYPYRLGSQNPQDNTVWGMNRINLGTTVVPGGQYTFTWTITAPTSPGTYQFQWRMVREAIQWFGEFSTSVPVTVSGCLQSVTIKIESKPTTDRYLRSHGMSVDQPLPVPWWPPYASGYEFLVTKRKFTYTTTVQLGPGSHYVEYAASGFVPDLAWHAKIYVNGVLRAEGDVGRYNHLVASFTV